MPSLAKRLQFVMEEKKITQEQLAKMIGGSQSAINKILQGETKKPRNLVEIADAVGEDVYWLRDGGERNKMPNAPITNNTYNYHGDSSGNYQLTNDGDISSIGKVNSIDDDNKINYELVDITYYDVKLSAGNGNTVEWLPNKFGEPVHLPMSFFKSKRLNPEICKAMTVQGRSMSPVLEDGDTVVISVTGDLDLVDLVDGEIYAVIYNNKFFIKQIIRSGNSVILHSYNSSEFPPVEIHDSDLPNLRILGKKVWRGG